MIVKLRLIAGAFLIIIIYPEAGIIASCKFSLNAAKCTLVRSIILLSKLLSSLVILSLSKDELSLIRGIEGSKGESAIDS